MINRFTPILSKMMTTARSLAPDMHGSHHKGEAGRIGVVGGSLEYTGAPYFAAISALRVGADLVHVFCSKSASTVIKSYSPELIVHPLLDSSNAIADIQPWLERLHVIVIGPGLGRDAAILETVSKLIRVCRDLKKPLVIDADGLHLVTQDSTLIKDYPGVILTPNAIEFSRLFGTDREQVWTRIKDLGKGVTVLEKAALDIIYHSESGEEMICEKGGSGRRCGGQGDLLSGSLATFYHWAIQRAEPKPEIIACYSASKLVKECNERVFRNLGRSMIATDMIDSIGPVFRENFEKKMETSIV